jgi:hypothetical protein
VVVRDGRVAEFAQDVKACALGQASAAVLGAVVLGRSRAELVAARDALAAMLKANGPVPAAPFEAMPHASGARLPQPPCLDPAGAGCGSGGRGSGRRQRRDGLTRPARLNAPIRPTR